MKIHKKTLRRAIPAALAAFLAIGPTVMTPASAAGGTFTATYTGSYTISGTCLLTPCTMKLTGKGTASFLGASTQTATLTGQACQPGSGTVHLKSTVTPANAIKARINWTVCISGGGITIKVNYTFKGGTGAFVNAKGTGTITGTATIGTSGTYKAIWNGTITY